MRTMLALIGTLLLAVHTPAQIVETVAGPSPRVNNGLTVHSSGRVYASDLFGSGFNGTTINSFTPEGESTLVASGISQPAGLIFGPDGDLYCAVFSGRKVIRIDSEGNTTDIATGISQPSGLVFDDDGNLYVTSYGSNRVYKITPGGESESFTTGLSQPVGIARDDEGFIYSADLQDGEIWKIDATGEKELLCQIDDTPLGFMTYLNESLYVNATGGNKIYKVDLDGTITHFAGSGAAASVDGPALSASFRDPDGIAASPNGDTLYVSENNSNRLRRILLNVTDVRESRSEQPSDHTILANYPNPFNASTLITLSLAESKEVDLYIYDNLGRRVATLFQGRATAGLSHFHWHGQSDQRQDVASGVYHLSLQTDQNTQHHRITLIR